MSDPRVPLKNQYLAAGLAYLIPGAGHFYQGRVFKGLVYSLCILGSFFYGMHLAEWKAVYISTDPTKRNLGYYAQVGTGLPALYAVWQARRYVMPDNREESRLDAPLSAPFDGVVFNPQSPSDANAIKGQIELQPGTKPGESVTGSFRGTDADGHEVVLSLGGDMFEMAPKIGGSPGRTLICDVVEVEQGDAATYAGRIRGDIPRKFLDWFEAPLTDEEIQDVNRKLGKRYELALVYTWIAGLLNILAIWDAMEGPAYGYGDEEEEDDEREKNKRRKEPAEQPPAKLEATAKP